MAHCQAVVCIKWCRQCIWMSLHERIVLSLDTNSIIRTKNRVLNMIREQITWYLNISSHSSDKYIFKVWCHSRPAFFKFIIQRYDFLGVKIHSSPGLKSFWKLKSDSEDPSLQFRSRHQDIALQRYTTNCCLHTSQSQFTLLMFVVFWWWNKWPNTIRGDMFLSSFKKLLKNHLFWEQLLSSHLRTSSTVHFWCTSLPDRQHFRNIFKIYCSEA